MKAVAKTKFRHSHPAISRLLVVFLASCLSPSLAPAGLLRVTSDSFFSRRANDLQVSELPMYEFLNASYTSERHDLEMNGNFSLLFDQLQKTNRFDLYTLDFTYEAMPGRIKIHGGRVFDFFRTSRASSSDSLGVDFILLDKRLTFGTFYGIERSLARGNFDASADLFGAYAHFKSDSFFPWFFGTKYQIRRYTDPKRELEHIARFSSQKSFSGSWSPEVLLDSEVILDSGHLSTLEGGVNLYPSQNTGLRARVLTYDIPPTAGVESPIFSVLSQGRLYEALTEVDQAISTRFSMSLGVAYDDFLLEGTTRTQGQRYELGSRYTGDLTSVKNALYLLNSYGGNVYGGRLDLAYRLTDLISLNGEAEITYYEKITASHRFATSTLLGVTTAFRKNLKLLVSSELNSNNSLQYDYRINAKLTYSFWSET